MYYVMIENGEIIGCGQLPCITEGVINVEVSEMLYNAVIADRQANNGQSVKYMYYNGEIVVNPEYDNIMTEKRRTEFLKDFFLTSLGYIRRKVSMKTGETKDFLTDLLPVISMAVSQGQAVNIITYREPDSWLEDVTDWEELQTVKVATPQFIQECFNQVSKDFTGI